MAELPTVLVVMALRVESDGMFDAAGVPVLYCGVGKVNAAIALTRELARYAHAGVDYPHVLNFGTCGSRVHDTGALVACERFVQRDMDVRGLGFELGLTPYDDAPACLTFESVFADLPRAICGSGDSFAISDSEVPCDVVDMEAYALAKTCFVHHVDFGCAKYVTDGADHAAADDWLSNVHKAAREFLALYRSVRNDPDRVTLAP